jgi:hypothetical protein
MCYIVNVVDKNIDYKDFLETNLMRLTMELVEWMEREMVELNKTSQYRGSIAEIRLFNALQRSRKIHFRACKDNEYFSSSGSSNCS